MNDFKNIKISPDAQSICGFGRTKEEAALKFIEDFNREIDADFLKARTFEIESAILECEVGVSAYCENSLCDNSLPAFRLYFRSDLRADK